ncbi:MAG: ABC transporter substrate-binding protein, partial [Bdellovibrionota bacterium]
AITLWAMITACTQNKKEIWIYTSIYQDVIEQMRPTVAALVPDYQVQWFQNGSENVMSRLNAELASGSGSRANLLLTSDPFAYLDLKAAGKLDLYQSPAAALIPANLKDDAFVTIRLPALVIAYNKEVAAVAAKPPTGWKDLTDPRFKDLVSMGSPIESGTQFTGVTVLSKNLGWEYFRKLRANGVLSAGGNSAVITRVESKERPVGIVLLENVLKAKSKGSPLEIVYPSEGAISVPSPIAILKGAQNPEAVRKIYDWFFTETAQKALVTSGMYSPLASIPSPPGGKPWDEVSKSSYPWSPEILAEHAKRREEVKKQFTEILLR